VSPGGCGPITPCPRTPVENPRIHCRGRLGRFASGVMEKAVSRGSFVMRSGCGADIASATGGGLGECADPGGNPSAPQFRRLLRLVKPRRSPRPPRRSANGLQLPLAKVENGDLLGGASQARRVSMDNSAKRNARATGLGDSLASESAGLSRSRPAMFDTIWPWFFLGGKWWSTDSVPHLNREPGTGRGFGIHGCQ